MRRDDASQHEHLEANLQVLREVFGRDRFRPGQAEAARAFYAGRDVQVVLPTGGGKSLCYQLPALRAAREGRGATLVVSPLIALMEDQVAALRALGVRAVTLHSGLPWPEQRAALGALDDMDLVYASPERLSSSRFRARLGHAGLALAAVDEAHCISEWGHDFRPEYRQLDVLKREFDIPIMAVTATASQRVLTDVAESLGLKEPVCIHGGFARPNLRFVVHHRSGDRDRLEWVCQHLLASGLGPGTAASGKAIVYTATRKRCGAVCKALRANAIPAACYHAGRSENARARVQAGFVEGRYPVLVATSAFGMGVDLPDVRLVLHVQAPAGLAAYYQQAGRAGRDDQPAECVLLYSPADSVIQARLRAKQPGAEEGWRALQDYAFSTRCRQQLMVEHFTGRADQACGCCDACREPERVRTEVDEARQRRLQRVQERSCRQKREAQVSLTAAQREQAVRFVDGLRKPLGRRLIALGLRGSRSREAKRKRLEDNPVFGALRGVPEIAITKALDDLQAEGRLAPMGRKYPTLWIPGKAVRSPRRSPAPGPRDAAGEIERELRNLQRREARRRRIRPYQVFPRQTLRAIAREQPQTRAQLAELWGMGATRIEKYGDPILEVVSRHTGLPRPEP